MRASVRVRNYSLAAAIFTVLHAAAPHAEAAESNPQQLPKISVEASEDSLKTEVSSSPKYTQPLLDTPQTITVIPQAVIRDRAAATLRDVLRNSPGITFQAGEGGAAPGDQNFSMRGTSARNSLFIDGVRDVGSYTRDSFNLQQVEVIKGPAAAPPVARSTRSPRRRDWRMPRTTRWVTAATVTSASPATSISA